MIEAIAPAPGRNRAQIVAAARACIGTRFRAQGRVPGLALDCVGLVLAAVGIDPMVVPAYALGGDHGDRLETALRAIGCEPAPQPLPGDILVLAPAPRQRHLAIVTPGGAVHAHAGLGRVVEAPLDPGWPCLGVWRPAGGR